MSTDKNEETSAELENKKSLSYLKTVVQNDFLEAQNTSSRMVNNAKANIASVLTYFNRNIIGSDSAESIEETDTAAGSFSDMKLIISTGLTELQEKACKDMRVASLYDRYVTRQTQTQIRREYLDGHYQLIRDRAVTDFKRLQEDTEEKVESTKLQFEEYVRNMAKDNVLAVDNNNADSIIGSLKTKALCDLEESNKKIEKLVDKTKMKIRENVNVFLTCPTGKKTQEEIESEGFIKETILDIKGKVANDMIATKAATDKIADETKQMFEQRLFSLDEDDQRVPLKPFDCFETKTKNDIKKAQDTINEDVANLKEKVNNMLKNEDYFSVVSLKKSLTNLVDKAQSALNITKSLTDLRDKTRNDIASANKTAQGNISDVKSSIMHKLTEDVDGESKHNPENVLVTFQEKALNDLKTTDETMKKDVNNIKLKVIESAKGFMK